MGHTINQDSVPLKKLTCQKANGWNWNQRKYIRQWIATSMAAVETAPDPKSFVSGMMSGDNYPSYCWFTLHWFLIWEQELTTQVTLKKWSNCRCDPSYAPFWALGMYLRCWGSIGKVELVNCLITEENPRRTSYNWGYIPWGREREIDR